MTRKVDHHSHERQTGPLAVNVGFRGLLVARSSEQGLALPEEYVRDGGFRRRLEHCVNLLEGLVEPPLADRLLDFSKLPDSVGADGPGRP